MDPEPKKFELRGKIGKAKSTDPRTKKKRADMITLYKCVTGREQID